MAAAGAGAEAPDADAVPAQTLSRGIRVLEAMLEAGRPQSVGAIAYKLGVHRSIVYRLLKTLMMHGLVSRKREGGYVLGLGLVALARGVDNDLRGQAHEALIEVADQLSCTMILSIADGEEMVCVVSAEPHRSGLRVVHREGLRLPVARGASGAALLSCRDAEDSDREAVRTARSRGWAVSEGDLEEGTHAVAVPVRGSGVSADASIAALFPATRRVVDEAVAERLLVVAKHVGTLMDLDASGSLLGTALIRYDRGGIS